MWEQLQIFQFFPTLSSLSLQMCFRSACFFLCVYICVTHTMSCLLEKPPGKSFSFHFPHLQVLSLERWIFKRCLRPSSGIHRQVLWLQRALAFCGHSALSLPSSHTSPLTFAGIGSVSFGCICSSAGSRGSSCSSLIFIFQHIVWISPLWRSPDWAHSPSSWSPATLGPLFSMGKHR